MSPSMLKQWIMEIDVPKQREILKERLSPECAMVERRMLGGD